MTWWCIPLRYWTYWPHNIFSCAKQWSQLTFIALRVILLKFYFRKYSSHQRLLQDFLHSSTCLLLRVACSIKTTIEFLIYPLLHVQTFHSLSFLKPLEKLHNPVLHVSVYIGKASVLVNWSCLLQVSHTQETPTITFAFCGIISIVLTTRFANH